MNQRFIYLDIEVYFNYFLVTLMLDDGRWVAFEMYEGKEFDFDGLTRFLGSGLTFVTFNGLNYDIPLIRLLYAGATCEQLKAASDDIINNKMKGWQFEKAYPQAGPVFDHIDIMEVAPGRVGLKLYAARLHMRELEELPIDPAADVTPDQREVLRRYCRKDLRNTRGVTHTLLQQLALRVALADELHKELEQHGLADLMAPPDLRSKSDAQIAEVVLKQRIFVRTGAIPRKREAHIKPFRYVPPDYIRFGSQQLIDALAVVTSADMVIDSKGHVKMPPSIKKLKIPIGGTTYKLGIGGLHSQESEVSHYADDDHLLRDIDVTSYYPQLMLNMGMYPDATGPHFLPVYQDILDERVAAKRAGNSVKADVLKITLNGTFGKTASVYSILYAPHMMIATTLTGQLSMLMLIEALERFGIPVVSANTDGIVVRCPRRLEKKLTLIVERWESITNLSTEANDYLSLHSRDVNSYVAIKPDRSAKTKGAFAKAGLAKNPQNAICIDAAVQFLRDGTPVEKTILECTDIRKFVTVRQVTGGAVRDGEHIGKVVRWYYSTEALGSMRYSTNGNAVPRSRRARPVMNLPDALPADLDFDWYVTEATELLRNVAAIPRPPKAKLPRRNTKAWKKLEEDGLVEVDEETDKPQWAVHYDQIPQEFKEAA